MAEKLEEMGVGTAQKLENEADVISSVLLIVKGEAGEFAALPEGLKESLAAELMPKVFLTWLSHMDSSFYCFIVFLTPIVLSLRALISS